MPRRLSAVLVPIALAALFLAACSGSDAAEAPAADADLHSLFESGATYSGVITTRVDTFNRCAPGGQLHLAGSDTYELAIAVVVGPPVVADDGSETNVLNLVIAPAATAGEPPPGTVVLVSAEAVDTPGGSRLLQFWDVAIDGQDLSGTLVETHDDKSLAYNRLAGEAPLLSCQPERGVAARAFVIETGARLTGVVTPERVSLQLEAAADGGLRSISAGIEAQR